jgi:Tetratricopeptide repeat
MSWSPAEPLYRRALEIDEKSFGPEDPTVARDLNNLAELLQATNRLGEAESLSRRQLQIFAKFGHWTGHEHPHFRAAFENYVVVLKAMGLSWDEIMGRVRSATEGGPESA